MAGKEGTRGFNDGNHDRGARDQRKGAHTKITQVYDGGRWSILVHSNCILTFENEKRGVQEGGAFFVGFIIGYIFLSPYYS